MLRLRFHCVSLTARCSPLTVRPLEPDTRWVATPHLQRLVHAPGLARGPATAIPFGYDKPRPTNVLSTIGLQSLTASICVRNLSVRAFASSLQRSLSRRILHNMLSLSG